MKRINISVLYFIGYAIHPLTIIEHGITFKDLWNRLYLAKIALERIEELDRMLNMLVSRSVYKDLKEKVTSLAEHAADDTVVDYGDYITLKSNAERLEGILAAEFQVVNTYCIAQTMAYDVRILIDKGEEVIPESLRDNLPDIVRKDLREAARCLAYRLNTAVGFHILRAVEGTIMEYFGLLSIPKPSKASERNLGNYINLLKSAGVDQKILLPLDQIRALHRNELMHPDRSLDDTESSSLFEVSKAALTAMLIDIKARTPAPPVTTAPAAIATPTTVP